MKLATFKSGGQEKIGIVHTGDTALFDLAAAATRNGSANPAFASMLALIDAGESALEQAAKVFDEARQGREPVHQDRDKRGSRAGP